MLVAITGTTGAGKSTVAEYLTEEHGFAFASGSQIIAEEVKRRNLKLNRNNMHQIANKLRKAMPTNLIKRTIDQVSEHNRAVIGFIRSKNSVLYIKKNYPNSVLLGIDAPVRLRFNRVREQNGYDYCMTFEEFEEFDDKEMHSQDPNEQNISYCLKECDYVITNDGSLDSLYEEVDRILQLEGS